MENRVYFKGLDENLRGLNGFQYRIGEIFNVDTDDTWRWLFFTSHIETAIKHGPRIVEVEPVSLPCTLYGNDNLCAKSIRICREIPVTEILARLAIRTLRKKDTYFCLRQLNMLSDGPNLEVRRL
jgi:hypothetical protein